MGLGLCCLKGHVFYTFNACLTQGICAGLFLSGVIALKPRQSALIASLWQEHLVTHKPAKAQELCQSCLGRLVFITSQLQPAAQAAFPARCHHLPRKEAELALPDRESSPRRCVVQGRRGWESGRELGK